MSYFRTGTTNMGTIKFRLGWHGGRTCAARPYNRSDQHGYNKIPFGVAWGTLLVIFFAGPAAAQWRQVLTINEGVNITYFVPESHLAIAASALFSGTGSNDSCCLWRSTDDGETWKQATPTYFGVQITGITFADSMTGWATLDNPSILYLLKTTDGGQTWFPLPCPLNPQGTYIYGLFYNPAVHLLMISDGGQSLLSTDGGLAWLSPVQYKYALPTGYYFLDSLHGAGSWNDQDFSVTSDGGFTWNNTVSGISGVRPSGYFRNGNRYYIVATPYSYTGWPQRSFNSIILSSDEGATWDSISTIPWGRINYVNSISGDIRKDCNIFYLNTGDSGIYRSDDSGKNWRCIGGPPAIGGGDYPLFDVKNGRILAGDGNGGLWLYTPPAYAVQFGADTLTSEIGSLARIPIVITNSNGNLLFDSASFEFDYDTNVFIFEGVESSSGYQVRFQKLSNGSIELTLTRDTASKVSYASATVTVLLNTYLSVPWRDSSNVTFHSALFNDLSACAPATQYITSAHIDIQPGCGDSTLLALMNHVAPFSIESIQPNPAQNEIMVMLSGAAQPTVEMYDALGRAQDVRSTSLPTGVVVDVSGVPSGSYILRVSDGEYVQSRRVAIQH